MDTQEAAQTVFLRHGQLSRVRLQTWLVQIFRKLGEIVTQGYIVGLFVGLGRLVQLGTGFDVESEVQFLMEVSDQVDAVEYSLPLVLLPER